VQTEAALAVRLVPQVVEEPDQDVVVRGTIDGPMQLAVGDARKTLQAAGLVMKEATSGDGLLAMLLTNEEVANNLRALVSNLRSHGVLFYRDSAAKVSPPPPQNSPPPRRPSSR